MRSIVEMERCVHFEKGVWDEFRIRMGDPNTPLPGEANYNCFRWQLEPFASSMPLKTRSIDRVLSPFVSISANRRTFLVAL